MIFHNGLDFLIVRLVLVQGGGGGDDQLAISVAQIKTHQGLRYEFLKLNKVAICPMVPFQTAIA